MSDNPQDPTFHKGDSVMLTHEAVEHYGDEWEGEFLIVMGEGELVDQSTNTRLYTVETADLEEHNFYGFELQPSVI